MGNLIANVVAPLVAAPSSIRQILAGEAVWRVPLPATEIVLPDGVRELDLVGMSLRDACTELRTVRANKNGQAFDLNIVASTTSLVRDGGIVPLDAWREDLHLFFPDNPAILWEHRSLIGPIGIAVAVELRGRNENGRMLQWWRFNDATEQSQTAHTLFALGDMRAASVGFFIRAWHKVSEEELKKLQKKFPAAHEWTWIVDRAELIETSAVSVGADPAALALGAGDVDLRSAFDALGDMYAYGRTYESQELYVKALAARCASGDGDACRILIDGFAGDDDDDRTAIPFSAHGGSYAVAPKTAAWDAGKELKAMPAERKPLRARHAWVNADADADVKSSYKFPHHRAASSKAVVFRACAAGFARLGSASVSEADRKGIARHLGRHYRDDFDVEPPKREAVELAAASLGAAMGTDESLDAWLETHRHTLSVLGGGCVTCGAEMVVGEGIRRQLEASSIEVDGLTECEVRTFIVANVGRVINSEAREARDRLRANGRK
ncbi:hypothetical protein LCGC14_1605110 [marine sediment metagenome]|uniref:Uncharacterized protein n=1 Tax=marine sediment metagenome TaxID=412755 RepID=A0A0F9L9Y7_9ZZZZ